jgi:ferredoxin
MIVDLGSCNPDVADAFTEEYFELMTALMQDSEIHARAAEFEKIDMDTRNDGRPVQRVVPRWKAIKDIPGVMPCEDIRELLKPYDGRLVAHLCGCRRTRARHCVVNDGTHPDEGLCISFDSASDYLVKELGMGSYRSWQQIMENLDGLNRTPTYHMMDNHRDPRFICNCCSCCCQVLLPKLAAGDDLRERLSPSRFLAIVSSEKCDRSKICVTKCPFHAITISEGEERAVIDAGKCMGCGTCVINCPAGAINMKIVRPPQHIPEMGVCYTNDAFDAIAEGKDLIAGGPVL